VSSDQPKANLDQPASGALINSDWGKAIVEHITRGSTVLALGSTASELTSLLVTDRECSLDALEPDDAQATELRQRCREVLVYDPEGTDLDTTLSDRRYDFIVCAELLERLRHPEHLLSELKAHLEVDGQLLLVVPNIAHIGVISELVSGDFHYREHGLLDRGHLRFFTRESLLRMLDEAGFVAEILATTTLSLGDSEFAQAQPIADELLSSVPITPDHVVYQFIATAQPRAKGQRRSKQQLHQSVAVATRDLGGTSRVFWRMIDEEYTMERSVAGTSVDRSGLLTVRLEIPRSPSERFLDLQLLDRVGVIEVRDVAITQNSKQIWHWEPEGADELFNDASQRHLIELHETAQEAGSPAHYFLLTPDNRAELNVKIPGGPHETIVELQYRQLRIAESTEVIGSYLAAIDQHASAKVAKVRGLLNADRVTRELILKGRIKFIEDEKLHLQEELALREKQLQGEKQALQRRIDELLGSTSWKLTAPVRAGKEQLIPKVKGLLSPRTPPAAPAKLEDQQR